METEELKDLSLRLLGYYNDENQTMQPEEKSPELAEALAELLSKTFDGIEDVNKDPDFKAAIENGVFIMRDRDFNLYAYFPKEKRAKVTDVEFNDDSLTSLRYEYKNWFVPGKELVIYEPGSVFFPKPNQYFYEYLRVIPSLGHQVELTADFLPENAKTISGELKAIGKDFIRLKDRVGQDVIISDHMLLRIDPIANVDKVEQRPEQNVKIEVEDEDPFIPALGVIIKFDNKKGLGFVRRYGDNATLGLKASELIDFDVSKSPLDKKVVFSTREVNYPNGKKWTHAIYVHASGKASKMLKLVDKLHDAQASRAVLQHILDSDPDNEDALLKLEELNSSNSAKIDEDTLKYKKAVDLLQKEEKKESDIKEAIDLLKSVLDNGKKIKDTITRLAIAYYMRYEQESDEYKGIRGKELYDFVKEHHSELSPAASRNMRLRYYGLLGYYDAYLDTIDSILKDPNIGNSKRAQMDYYKAMYYNNHLKDEEKAQSYAEESLYLKPFDNNAELFLIPELSKPSSPHSSDLVSCLLYIKNDKKSDDGSDYVQLVEQLGKTDSKYGDYLLKAARKLSENDDTRGKAISYLAEYIAIQANYYAQDDKSLSAVYYWSELFGKILPGFGHFSRKCFAEFLAHVLGEDIRSNPSMETYVPWENRKVWGDVLLKNPSDITGDQWNQIIYVVGNNQAIRQAVCELILDNSELRESFAKYADVPSSDLSEETIKGTFDVRKDKLFENDFSAIQQIDDILKSADNLDDFHVDLKQISIQRMPFSKIVHGGKELLKRLVKECLPILGQYVSETDTNSRYPLSSDLVRSLKSLYKDIWDAPTPFCINGLWQIISFIQSRIKIVLPLPELKLTITQEMVVRDMYGSYEIKGEISVGQYQLDAHNVNLSMKNSKQFFTYKPHPFFIIKSIKSGEKVPFSFRVTLPNNFKKSSFTFAIQCEYEVKGKLNTKIFNPLQIHIVEQDAQPFVPIKIHYNPSIGGLEPGDPTFVGRVKDIEKLVDMVMEPTRASQVIVYGQRRCGKTTLVKALIKELESKYSDKVWCVFTELIIENNPDKLYDDRSFYMFLLEEIRTSLNTYRGGPKPVINVPEESAMRETDSPTRLFCDTIRALKQSMAITPGWENRRLVMVVDEFTVLYGSIKSGKASTDILRNWKAIQEDKTSSFVTIFVGHDITTAMRNEPYAENAMGIITPYQLSYLVEEDAIELIDRPTMVNGQSRFEDKAKKRILYYTGRSPFYIQTFMSRMVDYINSKEFIKYTAIDVEIVAQRFITRDYAELSSIGDFNNLINSGLQDIYNDLKDEDVETVLRTIARNSNDFNWCKRTKVEEEITYSKTRISRPKLAKILTDLDARKVIIIKDGLIRIIVGLFKEWLKQN